MDRIIINIRLAWNLTCVFFMFLTCNPIDRFSKFVVMLIVLRWIVVIDYNQVNL